MREKVCEVKRNIYNKLRFSSCSAQPYVLHEKNLSIVDGVIRLPLYMTPWLVDGGNHLHNAGEQGLARKGQLA